ncbi:MAG TPA: hypothetical protein VKE94_22210 [Gemmataceae bacterium]|nr:hypothetical protein [Gemmataceae bacterium]
MNSIRNRIVAHVTVRAGDLVPHPNNWRRHPPDQRRALGESLTELGDIRSLLGYRLPDGRIQLIDGHLRRDLDPERVVTVELVDLSEEEAAKALLTLDPLAALAETDAKAAQILFAGLRTESDTLRGIWQGLSTGTDEARKGLARSDETIAPPEQFLVLIECRDEAQQVELLERFGAEGLRCKAIVG